MTSTSSSCLPLLFHFSSLLCYGVRYVRDLVVLTACLPSLPYPDHAVSPCFYQCQPLCLEFQAYNNMPSFFSLSQIYILPWQPPLSGGVGQLSVFIFIFPNLISSLNYICVLFPISSHTCSNLCLSHFCSFSSNIVPGIQDTSNCLPNEQIKSLPRNVCKSRNS